MRIVLDTNVLVAALFTEAGAPAQVLDLCFAGDFQLAVDDRILAEYRDVLRRREFGFNAGAVRDVIAFLERSECVVAAPVPIALPDRADQPFLEVAVAAGVDAIVTGNVRHFRVGGLDVEILTPRKVLDRLAGTTERAGNRGRRG